MICPYRLSLLMRCAQFATTTCAATSLANTAAKWRSTRFFPPGFNDDRDFVILAAISGSAGSVMGFSIGPGLQEITD